MAQAEGASALSRSRLAVALVGLAGACSRPPPAEPNLPVSAPVGRQVGLAPVRARFGRPGIPEEVRRAEDFVLVGVRTGTAGAGWRGRRALLAVGGSTRAFAVGDLLPGRGVVTAIGAEEMRYLHQGQLYAVTAGQKARLVDDLEPVSRRVRPVRASPAVRAAVDEAVRDLAGPDPAEVAGALSALIGAGEDIVALLAAHAHDRRPVVIPEVSAWGRVHRALYVGDYVVAALETITEQSFGSPLTGNRAAIAEDWRLWSGAAED